MWKFFPGIDANLVPAWCQLLSLFLQTHHFRHPKALHHCSNTTNKARTIKRYLKGKKNAYKHTPSNYFHIKCCSFQSFDAEKWLHVLQLVNQMYQSALNVNKIHYS